MHCFVFVNNRNRNQFIEIPDALEEVEKVDVLLVKVSGMTEEDS